LARARNIKPGFFKNEDLAGLAPMARLLFIGLWTLADRAGRLENRPKRIKAEVFPYDDADVVKLLFSIQNAGFIQCYEVEKVHLIQIVNWDKHQNPHHKENASVLPAPEKLGKDATSPVLAVLIPDSLIPDSGFPQPAAADEVTEENMDLIRQSYPHSAGKPSALKAIKKAIERERKAHGSRKDAARYLYKRALAYRAINAEWPPGDRKQFTPMCATWFNDERYNDPDETYRRNGNHGKTTKRIEHNDNAGEEALALLGHIETGGPLLPAGDGPAATGDGRKALAIVPSRVSAEGH
jgi:hypothetical protein